MQDVIRLAGAANLASGEMSKVYVERNGALLSVLLVNIEGEIVALDGLCTHAGGPLEFGFLEGDEIICPLHGGSFNVRSGEVVGPPPEEPLRRYGTTLDGGDILLDLTPLREDG